MIFIGEIGAAGRRAGRKALESVGLQSIQLDQDPSGEITANQSDLFKHYGLGSIDVSVKGQLVAGCTLEIAVEDDGAGFRMKGRFDAASMLQDCLLMRCK